MMRYNYMSSCCSNIIRENIFVHLAYYAFCLDNRVCALEKLYML